MGGIATTILGLFSYLSIIELNQIQRESIFNSACSVEGLIKPSQIKATIERCGKVASFEQSEVAGYLSDYGDDEIINNTTHSAITKILLEASRTIVVQTPQWFLYISGIAIAIFWTYLFVSAVYFGELSLFEDSDAARSELEKAYERNISD